jgi:hypothetical protein
MGIVTDQTVLMTLTNGVMYRTFRLSGTPADQNLIVSKEAWKLISADYTSTVAGTDAGTVTLQLTKCTGTTAPASGTALLSATIDLKTTANTTAAGTLVSNQSTLSFTSGDRLAVDVTGTTTAVDGIVTIGYQKV